MGRIIHELNKVKMSETRKEKILETCLRYEITNLEIKEQKTDFRGNIYPRRLVGRSKKDGKMKSFTIDVKLPNLPIMCGVCKTGSDIMVSIYAGIPFEKYETLNKNIVIGYAWNPEKQYYIPIHKKEVKEVVIVG